MKCQLQASGSVHLIPSFWNQIDIFQNAYEIPVYFSARKFTQQKTPKKFVFSWLQTIKLYFIYMCPCIVNRI